MWLSRQVIRGERYGGVLWTMPASIDGLAVLKTSKDPIGAGRALEIFPMKYQNGLWLRGWSRFWISDPRSANAETVGKVAARASAAWWALFEDNEM